MLKQQQDITQVLETKIKMTTNARLERIEEKLDGLTEAMIALARAEEKIASIQQAQDSGWERMNRFSEKLDSIERQVQDNAQTVKIINKLFWVAIVAVSGAIAAQMWM
jgi:ABC-type transport system involved in cytochrome bd biosynthesis fused ATPase/permease subunit